MEIDPTPVGNEHSIFHGESLVIQKCSWSMRTGPPRDRAGKKMVSLWRKSRSVAVSSRFKHNMMTVLVIDIRGIRYYEILAKNDILNAARYLQETHELQAIKGALPVYLMTTSDLIDLGSVTFWTEQGNIRRGFTSACSPDLRLSRL